MDGRGRCLDNVFIECLWRSLKYEAVYLHELADGFVTERVIGGWFKFYNTARPRTLRSAGARQSKIMRRAGPWRCGQR